MTNAATRLSHSDLRERLLADFTADNKVYDGTTVAVAHLSDNRLAGDVFSDSYTSAAFADKNVGTVKTVTVSGLSISGTDAVVRPGLITPWPTRPSAKTSQIPGDNALDIAQNGRKAQTNPGIPGRREGNGRQFDCFTQQMRPTLLRCAEVRIHGGMVADDDTGKSRRIENLLEGRGILGHAEQQDPRSVIA